MSVRNMKEKTNTISILSNGSKKILNLKQNSRADNISTNSNTNLNFEETKSATGRGSEGNSKVHNRLYNDSSYRKLKKIILTNKYRNQHHSHHHFDFLKTRSPLKSLISTGKV